MAAVIFGLYSPGCYHLWVVLSGLLSYLVCTLRLLSFVVSSLRGAIIYSGYSPTAVIFGLCFPGRCHL